MAIEVRDGVEGKVCPRCSWKPLVEYRSDRSNKYGTYPICKACEREKENKARLKNPDHRCAMCARRRGDFKDYGGPLDEEFGAAWGYCKACKVVVNQRRRGNRSDAADRRARERDAEGQHTPEETALLKFLYGETCPACHFRPVGHVDHVEPLNNPDKGWHGSDWVSNLQWLCPDCNITKSDRNANDFRPDGGEAARAVQRLELYKVRNSQHRKLYAGWIRRRLEVYETLEEKTAVLLALSVRDEIEVGFLVKGILKARAAEDAARAGTVRQS